MRYVDFESEDVARCFPLGSLESKLVELCSVEKRLADNCVVVGLFDSCTIGEAISAGEIPICDSREVEDVTRGFPPFRIPLELDLLCGVKNGLVEFTPSP